MTPDRTDRMLAVLRLLDTGARGDGDDALLDAATVVDADDAEAIVAAVEGCAVSSIDRLAGLRVEFDNIVGRYPLTGEETLDDLAAVLSDDDLDAYRNLVAGAALGLGFALGHVPMEDLA